MHAKTATRKKPAFLLFSFLVPIPTSQGGFFEGLLLVESMEKALWLIFLTSKSKYFFIVLIAGREDFFSQGPLHTDWNGLSCSTEDSGLSLLITMQLMQLTHLN